MAQTSHKYRVVIAWYGREVGEVFETDAPISKVLAPNVLELGGVEPEVQVEKEVKVEKPTPAKKTTRTKAKKD